MSPHYWEMISDKLSREGFCVGHVGPEAAVGGPIALLKNGDKIVIDAAAGTIDMMIP